ncbi:MAG: UvrD-helicase domain-containing protein [Candidatus Omnitrophica bacterium]|nr:UvrD-helicase domain-containing protein [Candidatus Omnitrophota bacterium]
MTNNRSEVNLLVKLIHASAGTGKTYWLTNEFINLVAKENFIDSMKKIIAITFSEKAACEMRTRIVQGIFEKIISGLNNEEEKIKCENQLFLLRVSTIHSFCRSLLKRFSFLFQIDPNFVVCESEQSYIFFQRAISLFLEKDDPERFIKKLKPMKLKRFLKYMEELKNTHPQVFLGRPGENQMSEPLFLCFQEINQTYSDIKKQNSVMDFNDLESLSYLLICEHPESLNVLNDFDESVDFIFVDEFQDTNLLQWKIIKEFSREWVSGIGAKAETGKNYGLFFVGDRKQSIYFFRGAENTVFDDADRFFGNFVKRDFLTTNYRSFPEIIEFVNNVFNGQDGFPVQENLSVSEKFSQRNRALVEIKFFDTKNTSIRDEKQNEYKWICEKILSLIESEFSVYDKNSDIFRPVEFRDIAVLIRKRTHLEILEELFGKYSIPFVNIGGIGFYQEDEIIFLISLLCVLADPSDTLSMANLENSIFHLDQDRIKKWRALLAGDFASSILDKIIMEIDMFSKLSSQGCANVEKFLMLIGEMEHVPFFQMVQNLRRISNRPEEPKADVFSEHHNAVRILTVHASKGLEFPVVFLAGIEQGKPDTGKIYLMHKRVEEKNNDYVFVFKNEKDDFYQDYVKKLEEEEKRILYVALTRARQCLFITGAKKKSVWFEALDNFQPLYPAKEVGFSKKPGFIKSEKKETRKMPAVSRKLISPVSFSSSGEVFSFEGEKTGTIIHRILWEISNNFVEADFNTIKERAIFLLKKTKMYADITAEMEIHLKNILKPQIKKIILPAKNSFSELPFLAEIDGKNVYGIVDRIVVENDICKIYDFKTRHSCKIMDKDIEQLTLYKNGISRIFPCRETQTFIVFTFCGIIESVET